MKRMSCPLYGCKRAYADANDLASHIKDHELPTESLPGKSMLCSITGCGGSFSNMQKLMEHMRHHHKPNIYFLCESCHAKLRSYRGLLVHLRTCAKAARPKPNPTPSPSTPSPSTAPPVPMDVDPVQPIAAPKQEPLDSPPPPQLPPMRPVSLPPSLLSLNQDLSPPDLMQQIIDSTVSALFAKNKEQYSPTSKPEAQIGQSANEGQAQQKSPKTPETSGQPKSMPQITNTYKSEQGSTPEKRIQWQHTRGRYTCVQCGHTVTNRKDMAEHSTVHSDSPTPKEKSEQPPLPLVRFS